MVSIQAYGFLIVITIFVIVYLNILVFLIIKTHLIFIFLHLLNV